MAIIEEITPTACRIRSLAEFSLGEPVSFDFTLRGAPKTPLTGRITSSAENGVRRSYTIAFDDLDGRQSDRITVALDLARRFADAHHIEQHSGTPLTRSSPRVPVDVAVTYVSQAHGVRYGRATNISTGGILMNASDSDVAAGTTLEVSFTLPGRTHALRLEARVVAHQSASPNYNMAFFNVPPEAHAELETYISSQL